MKKLLIALFTLSALFFTGCSENVAEKIKRDLFETYGMNEELKADEFFRVAAAGFIGIPGAVSVPIGDK